MKRLFAAIKVTPQENLINIYNNLKSGLQHEKINWVAEQNIHITLKFFGETPEDKIDDICDVLDEVSGRHKPFELQLQNVGIFGSAYNPRVIWFGIRDGSIIETLAIDVLDSVEDIGFERDRQNFRPHLTVGRIKFIRDKRYFQQAIDKLKTEYLQTVPVNSIYLFESKLRPQGPVYNVIEEFGLG